MRHEPGTKIIVTKLSRKDFSWPKNTFKELSEKVNGKEGVILSYNPEAPEYGERESYMARIQTDENEFEEIEMEEDEFEVLN